MKTKFSRFGRSSVSVILAVMMLLSTMLVGTVSTVNAAGLSNATKVYLDSSAATVNGSSLSNWNNIYAYAFKDNSGVNTYTDDNANGKNTWPGSVMHDEGDGIYSVYVDNSATKIIFNNNSRTQTGNLSLPENWQSLPMIYKGNGTEAQGSDGWSTYSTVKPVADSVSLTAEPSSIKEGETVTLTANLTNKNSDLGDVTYTFTDAANNVVGTKTTSDSSASIEVTPSSTTAYTVTVSAEDYDSVTASATVTVVKPVSTNYEFMVQTGSSDTSMGKFTELDGVYSLDVNFAETGAYKFFVKNGGTYYRNASGTLTDVSSKAVTLYQYGSNVSTHYVTLNVETAGTYGIKMEKSGNDFLVSLTKVPEPVTKHNVTFGANSADMGSVSVSDGTTSFTTSPASVEEGKNVTLTANANDGYKFVGWYDNAECTGDALGTDASYTVSNLTADVSVYAKFTEEEYTVNHTQGTGYTVSGLPTSTVAYKGNVQFTVTPEKGYKIDSVALDDTTLTGTDGTYSFEMPAKDVTVIVNASLDSYSINNGSTETATFTVGGKAVDTAKMGDVVTVSASKTGSTLTSIDVVADNGDAVSVKDLTFTMPASSVTVTLNFTLNSYKITYKNEVTGLKGLVVAESAKYGDTVSVTVTADGGYYVKGISINDGAVEASGSNGTYTFVMPDSDVNIVPEIGVAPFADPTVAIAGIDSSTVANVKGNYNVTFTATAGDSYSAIADADKEISVKDKTEGVDYTLTKLQEGIYIFTPLTDGEFTITFTATAKSTLDSSMEGITKSASVTVNVNFTETQTAYNALNSYVNSDDVKAAVANHEKDSTYYTAESYAAFESALNAAQALLTGLPVASVDNAALYTDAQTALETALSKLEVETHYYIGGRFMGENWNPERTDWQMTKVDGTTGLYKYETKMTVAQLSVNVESTNQYFFIHTGNGYKGDYYGSIESNGHSFQNNTESNKLSVKKYNNEDKVSQYVKFADTNDKSANVVIYFDISDSDNPKLYYTADPQLRITGSVEGGAEGWNNSYDTALKFDTREADGSYSKTFNISAEDIASGNNYFRLIDSEKYSTGGKYKEYGPFVSETVTDNLAIDDYTSIDKAYSSYENSASSFYFKNVGTYKLHYIMGTATPKVWVEFTAETKDITFSITGESGTVKLNGNEVADADVKSLVVGSDYTITVTPDDDSYIKTFTVNGTAVEGNTYNGNVSEDIAVVVELAKKTLYSVTTGTSEGGSVSVDPVNAYEGQTVKVTPSAESNYLLDSISVKTSAEPQQDVELTNNGDGTYSFTMPAENVTVYPTFRAKKSFTVKVSSDNQELGTVSLNGSSSTLETTVKEGDSVTIEAAPTGSNKFNKWTIEGTYTISGSQSETDSKITFVVNSDINATASFTKVAPYQVAYGSNGAKIEMVSTKNEGIYISTATVPVKDIFTIYNTADSTYAYVNSDGTYWVNAANPSPTVSKWVSNYNDHILLNAYSSAMYVIYNEKTNTITLSDTFDTGDKATLYVKTGTSGTGATGEYAASSLAPNLTPTSTGATYNKYSVEYDTSVNIRTTMSDKFLKARYYVAAYSVNGRSYPASALDAAQGIYQANITITEDLAENGVIEVTPIYYNRTIEEDDNYITFYVDAAQAVADWGSTISVDAYSYKNGNKTEGELHAFGTYPGQPMVKDGQYYVIKVPKYYYEVSADGTLTIDKNSPISGVTLNNYYNDAVHNSLVPVKRNMQTYDFSDFVALANLEGVRTIMFQSKFYNATGDAKENRLLIYNNSGEIVNPAYAKTHIDNIESANVNPYEDFGDYYGRATDVLGNILTDEQKSDSNNLYIISTGSYNNQSDAYATKGQWVTIWNVYDHNGNLVTYGTPADFLNENSSVYQKLNTADYLGKPVKISYEKGMSYDKGSTSRTDGRWYYSKLGQEFTSDVAIEYKNADGTYVTDVNKNTENTGYVGTVSGATATINNVTTASFTSVTDTAHLNIKVANGWRFDGWYINGNKIGDNYTDISTDILMSNSYHIVARVSEIPVGTLELNHTAYTGTDPAAHSGTGFYYISAKLTKGDGSVVNYPETQGVISIPNYAADDVLEITLRTVCHGDNTIYALYEGEAGGYYEIGDDDYRDQKTLTYTFTVEPSSLFLDDVLKVSSLNYYTDIVKVGGTCDITYKYYDRFGVEGAGNMVSYVVKNVELSTLEIQDNYKPSDDTITKYAPRIDTMYTDTKWDIADATKVEKGKSQATVIATQTEKMVKVYYPEKDGDYYQDVMVSKPYEVKYNSLLMDKDGNFILSAPEISEDGTKKFSYWQVTKVDANGESTGEVVTKCYERNFGLRIMADYYIVPVYEDEIPSLTANISSPVLNREIYGESTSATDKLYVDLLTAFTSTAVPTFKENTTDLTVECGVFVVRNNTTTLSAEDRDTLVNAAKNDADDTTASILNNYKMSSEVEASVKAQLETLAQDSSVKNNTNNTYKFGSDEFRVTKFVFDNSKLTNKNRIDKVLRYTNNTANQNYIFTAYAFVVIKNADGSVSEMQISEAPQYYNFCYVGNKA